MDVTVEGTERPVGRDASVGSACALAPCPRITAWTGGEPQRDAEALWRNSVWASAGGTLNTKCAVPWGCPGVASTPQQMKGSTNANSSARVPCTAFFHRLFVIAAPYRSVIVPASSLSQAARSRERRDRMGAIQNGSRHASLGVDSRLRGNDTMRAQSELHPAGPVWGMWRRDEDAKARIHNTNPGWVVLCTNCKDPRFLAVHHSLARCIQKPRISSANALANGGSLMLRALPL